MQHIMQDYSPCIHNTHTNTISSQNDDHVEFRSCGSVGWRESSGGSPHEQSSIDITQSSRHDPIAVDQIHPDEG